MGPTMMKEKGRGGCSPKHSRTLSVADAAGRFLGEPFSCGGYLSRSSLLGAFLIWLSFIGSAQGGSYLDSAHGNAVSGVDRSAMDAKFAEYATGNCAHCHEMHASMQGVEPAPAGGPAPHALFARGFNPGRTLNPYQMSDNFCFYCHSEETILQTTNRDYSAVFGGAHPESGPQSIMAAFNQASYHNLYDIGNFLTGNPAFSTWYSKRGNPCSGCHDSHKAKRNWDGMQPGFPLLSAISKPGERNLWGEVQLMSSYSSYEAPAAFGSSREPAGIGEPDGSKTPDYPGFCSSCHNETSVLWSTTLNRELKKINWGSMGEYRDKHGSLARSRADHLREPYETAAAFKSNFILSCLDCHESHGSENIMLLRRRINGENLEGIIAATETMGFACSRCHKDDEAAAAGTGERNRWEYAHHIAPGAPYSKTGCMDCHADAGGGSPIDCGNCHGHGMKDSWAGANQTGRNTF
jgi:hypothetical protein